MAGHGHRLITAGAVFGPAAVAGALAAGWPDPAAWTLAPGTLLCGIGQGWVMTPLFRIDVPTELAGVGSGVLATMQQSALALGVATLGSLYLGESPPGHLGALAAALAVLAVLMVIRVTVALGGPSCPTERRPAQRARHRVFATLLLGASNFGICGGQEEAT